MRQQLRVVIAMIGIALVGACGSEQAVTFTGAEPPEPASVRLFLNGGEVTDHLPLNSGFTQEIEVRLYAANGIRIVGYDSHFDVAFIFTPANLASVEPVADKPLVKALTPIAPADTPGTVQVSLNHAHTTTSRTFGPFEMLIH